MDTPKFAAFATTTVDTAYGLSSQMLGSVERLTALNLQVFKTTLAEASETTMAAFSAKSADELTKLQAATLQAIPSKVAAYTRQVIAILTSATAEQTAAAEAQMAETQAKLLDAVSTAFKNAPGSENALTLVKTAIAASNNAYDGVKKASKQVTEAVDANITKITETATTAARSSAKAVEG